MASPKYELLENTIMVAKYDERAPSGKKTSNVFCTGSHRRMVFNDADQCRKTHERLIYPECAIKTVEHVSCLVEYMHDIDLQLK